MEDDTRFFLITIMQTVSLAILWMLINVIVGIKMKLGLFESAPTLKNYIYYACCLVTLLLLVRYVIRKWSKVQKF